MKTGRTIEGLLLSTHAFRIWLIDARIAELGNWGRDGSSIHTMTTGGGRSSLDGQPDNAMTLASPRSLLPPLPALLAFSLLAGCAGLESRRETDIDRVRGVAYYMPMRYFQLTVTKAQGAITKLEWSASEPFADLSHTYSLRFNPHWIGKTTVSVVVGQNGLMGSANTKTTDAIAELATVTPNPVDKGAKMMLARRPDELAEVTCGDGILVFLFLEATSGDAPQAVCGGDVQFRIARTGMTGANSWPEGARDNAAAIAPGDASVAGVYYRVNRPYLASAWAINRTSGAPAGETPSLGQVTTRVLLVPNESPTMLLPFGRTLLAENDGKMTFQDGTLTNYTQADQGELVALLKFPAVILEAYFAAIGNVFNAFSSRNAKETELAIKELRLDMLRFQIEKCREALDKKDTAAYDALQCGNLRSAS
ncbi:hypothetical protein [Mitsuaria sp. GD03876]|uniref:hypothetical protein n=1 Tax=Mitsuaria sp. GD03876 TaxID=2975399 RepID=UPI00244A1618|nr:hypothetical protein [Mitsuaria sp. GD03876]MDH0865001.1 hypothetical protein [Mitsuaria sp. GD03876]